MSGPRSSSRRTASESRYSGPHEGPMSSLPPGRCETTSRGATSPPGTSTMKCLAAPSSPIRTYAGSPTARSSTDPAAEARWSLAGARSKTRPTDMSVSAVSPRKARSPRENTRPRKPTWTRVEDDDVVGKLAADARAGYLTYPSSGECPGRCHFESGGGPLRRFGIKDNEVDGRPVAGVRAHIHERRSRVRFSDRLADH